MTDLTPTESRPLWWRIWRWLEARRRSMCLTSDLTGAMPAMLTDTESRALARDGMATVVRPMEWQPRLHPNCWKKFDADAGEFRYLDIDDPMLNRVIVSPYRPGDTLADGSRVVSVEAMRLDDTSILCAHREGLNVVDRWNETYGHRPDWRYEANPGCWVVGVET